MFSDMFNIFWKRIWQFLTLFSFSSLHNKFNLYNIYKSIQKSYLHGNQIISRNFDNSSFNTSFNCYE